MNYNTILLNNQVWKVVNRPLDLNMKKNVESFSFDMVSFSKKLLGYEEPTYDDMEWEKWSDWEASQL